MPLILALHGQTKSTKNNATHRVCPYGVVSYTILHSIIIHSIGLNMKHTATQLISSTASAYGIHPSILIEDDGFVTLLKNLLKENASWPVCVEALHTYINENF